jgi:O-succinylbenzoic acid--CoA ligase
MRVVDGEVQLSGPMLAEGYLADPERTDAAFVIDDGRRWYRTGDAGEIVDGVVRISGRLDDVIISGGLKVSLGEVESIVREHAGYSSAVVVRAPSEPWGEVPVIVREGREPADFEDVRASVVAALGKAAGPAGLVSVERMPLTATGKPDRRALEAGLASGIHPVADR